MDRKEEWKIMAALMTILVLFMAILIALAVILNKDNTALQGVNLAQGELIAVQETYIAHLESALQARWSRDVDVTAYHERGMTASMTMPRPGGTVAVSRDLFDDGWTFGKRVYLAGYGIFEITDLMHERWKDRIDLFMGSVPEAKEFGIKTARASLVER